MKPRVKFNRYVREWYIFWQGRSFCHSRDYDFVIRIANDWARNHHRKITAN